MTRHYFLFFVSLLTIAAAPPPIPDPLVGLVARSIGPATMSGRITSLAVVESDPRIQYVGAASGGVWKTTTDGKSWECVFPGRPHAAIGAVAVSQSHPRVVYVGTGEANPRNSVSWGNGVFVSQDGGKSWTHAGLVESHHVGRIAVHPKDPNVAYVAALGHLWAPNPERGLFGTRDGGKTWQHLLQLDNETGCIDVVIDPTDPDTVYAAAYRVRRDEFSGGNPAVQFGARAGIYKSSDAGQTWKRLTRGLPGSAPGRIGLSVWRKDPRLVYAVVQTEHTNIRNVTGQGVGFGPIETGGVFYSRDKGETWHKVNDLCPRPFYFGQIRLDPTDSRRVWVLGIPLFVSVDGGRSFSADGAKSAHYDHHDLWINPADFRHLLLGTDGGLYVSRDRGFSWGHVATLPISQFYAVAVDRQTPYRIYGGLQDNGTWYGPSRTNRTTGIWNGDWKQMLGMDGFQCQVPPDDPTTVYAQGQYGQLHRIEVYPRRATVIKPRSTRADAIPYRFNWSSPLVLSAHDTRTLYYGGECVFKSPDSGQTWYKLSEDLTKGQTGKSPATNHTLTAIAESPLRQGVLYAGSDDGRVHVTRDDGKTWVDVSANVPGPAARWITRIECSSHEPGTAWLSLVRHRQGDRGPYLFQTDDYGTKWRSIVGNLPTEGPVHVVRGDARNASLLYAGTEFGLFVSLDSGGTWQAVRSVPSCPVHDLVVQPRERELVVATHGRGLYVLDVTPLQELTPAVREEKVRVFEVRDVVLRKLVDEAVTTRTFFGANPPTGAVVYYRLAEQVAGVDVEVRSAGRVVARWKASGEPGLHRVIWDLKDREGAKIGPGEYVVRVTAGGGRYEKPLCLRAAE